MSKTNVSPNFLLWHSSDVQSSVQILHNPPASQERCKENVLLLRNFAQSAYKLLSLSHPVFAFKCLFSISCLRNKKLECLWLIWVTKLHLMHV